MKKLLALVVFVSAISCNAKEDEVTDDASQNQPGIENVNGNIPDTTNSINLDNNKTDSATVMKDSTKKTQ
ncbi:MAG: hypothetical protein ABIR81_00220 [Ginsengibacter sp.]